jgi:hypothetical protein
MPRAGRMSNDLPVSEIQVIATRRFRSLHAGWWVFLFSVDALLMRLALSAKRLPNAWQALSWLCCCHRTTVLLSVLMAVSRKDGCCQGTPEEVILR